MENQYSQDPANTGDHRFNTRRIVFIVLVLLSIAGIGVMDFSEKFALNYWLAMVPVFAGASLALAWHSAPDRDATAGQHITRQILHWLVLVLGVLLIFLLRRYETVSHGTAGLLALLMLSMSCLTAGVHFEWRMAVLGGILTLTFVAGVFVDSFFWILLVPALIGVALLLRGKRLQKT